MSFVPGTPTNLDASFASALRKTVYDNTLRIKQVRPSVFNQEVMKTKFKISGMGEVIINKPNLVLDVSNVGVEGQGQSVTLGIRTPLRKAFNLGPASKMLGAEDESTLLWVNAPYNEIKKAVKYYQRGYYFNDTNRFKFNEGYDDLLALAHGEFDDDRIQQTLMLTFGPELLVAPVSRTARFNHNVAVPNLAPSSYPAYDTGAVTNTAVPDIFAMPTEPADGFYVDTYSVATHVQNIAAALLAAAGVGATPKAVWTVDAIIMIKNWLVQNKILMPIVLDGIYSYLWKIDTNTKNWALNPNNTGSLAKHMQSVSSYKDPDRPILIGEIGRLMSDIVVIEDTRCPTLTVGGTAQAYTLTPGFLHPGNNDDRNMADWANTSGDTNYVFDVTTIMGAEALLWYKRDKLVSNLVEQSEYQEVKGQGTYKGEGMQIPCWDLDAGHTSNATQYQTGACMVPISRALVGSLT